MEELEHECQICGKRYHHCNACNHNGVYLPWRASCCSPRCFQVLMAWKQYQGGTLSREEMQQTLLRHGFNERKVLPALQVKFDELLADTAMITYTDGTESK